MYQQIANRRTESGTGNMNILPKPLRGVIPAMITPLRDRDRLNVDGLERLIEHILGAGVNGLFILGTTGEAPALSYQTRQELVERACRQVAGRVPVLVGITDTAFRESLNSACHAQRSGAQAVVVSAPFYFPAAQSELLHYLEDLTSELPLPMFLYNAPTNTHHVFEPQTVRRAADLPNVVGLKDSSANMIYLHTVQELLNERPEFTCLVGPEELMAEAVLLGAHGGMCGGANFFPRLYVDLYKAAAECDLKRVRMLQRRVMQISTTIYRIYKDDSSYLRGLKCAVSLTGICDDFMAEPFQSFGPEERQQVKNYMQALGLLTP